MLTPIAVSHLQSYFSSLSSPFWCIKLMQAEQKKISLYISSFSALLTLFYVLLCNEQSTLGINTASPPPILHRHFDVGSAAQVCCYLIGLSPCMFYWTINKYFSSLSAGSSLKLVEHHANRQRNARWKKKNKDFTVLKLRTEPLHKICATLHYNLLVIPWFELHVSALKPRLHTSLHHRVRTLCHLAAALPGSARV